MTTETNDVTAASVIAEMSADFLRHLGLLKRERMDHLASVLAWACEADQARGRNYYHRELYRDAAWARDLLLGAASGVLDLLPPSAAAQALHDAVRAVRSSTP
jgi:hypothetical protein